MTTTEAIGILTRHQAWRRGADTKPTDPTNLGIAIDTALEALVEKHTCINCDQEKEVHFICKECLDKIIKENKPAEPTPVEPLEFTKEQWDHIKAESARRAKNHAACKRLD
jgi:hypothetical protein